MDRLDNKNDIKEKMSDEQDCNYGFLIRPKHPPIEKGINEHSLVSESLYQWAEDLISHVGGAGRITDIKLSNANRKNIESLLDSDPEAPVLFYGHGDEDNHLLLGFNGSAVLDTNNNTLLRNRKVLIVACCSEYFANDCIKKGVLYYIGYHGQPYIPMSSDSLFVQDCFKRPNNNTAQSVLSSGSILRKIEEKMRELYDELIAQLFDNPETEYLALFLNSNLQKLTIKYGTCV
jgi:hypothetical protein